MKEKIGKRTRFRHISTWWMLEVGVILFVTSFVGMYIFEQLGKEPRGDGVQAAVQEEENSSDTVLVEEYAPKPGDIVTVELLPGLGDTVTPAGKNPHQVVREEIAQYLDWEGLLESDKDILDQVVNVLAEENIQAIPGWEGRLSLHKDNLPQIREVVQAHERKIEVATDAYADGADPIIEEIFFAIVKGEEVPLKYSGKYMVWEAGSEEELLEISKNRPVHGPSTIESVGNKVYRIWVDTQISLEVQKAFVGHEQAWGDRARAYQYIVAPLFLR